MIHEIEKCDLKVSATPLPFEQKNKARIDVFWDQAFEANPQLWNGVFYMFSDVHIVDGVIGGTAHKTDFATFLFWRDHGQDQSVSHITGITFPALDDGSLLAVRMSRHTANAGRIYFPAGSFDSADIVAGKLDPVTSFSREMEEEIGIKVQPKWLNGPLLVSSIGNAYHVTQKMQVPMSFEKIEKHWQKHRLDGGDDEVSELVQIENVKHIPDAMPHYARDLCRYHFDPLET